MSDLFQLQELHVNDEASFLANANSIASNTYSTRLPFETAEIEINQSRMSDMTTQERKNASRPGYLGLRTGRLTITGYVPGAMTDPGAGAPTTHWFYEMLRDALGGGLITDDGGTLSGATDADTMVTTGVSTITPGTIVFIGAKGDGRGDGQGGAVATWSAGNLQLLNAVAGTPAAADAVRVGMNIYPTEANPTVTKRFLCLAKTTGAIWQLMGCQMDSASFEFPIESGGPIKYTFVYQAAYWDQGAAASPASLPSGVALPNCDTAVIAGGSFCVQNFGTTARTLVSARTLTLSLRMGLAPEVGPAAAQPHYTNITGWQSLGCVPTITFAQPWSSSAKTSFDADGSSTTFKQFYFQSNSQPGRRMAFYMPRAYPSGETPQRTNVGGLLLQTLSFTGAESTTTTSDLTQSAIRFCLG
jgi:hypothetical protein